MLMFLPYNLITALTSSDCAEAARCFKAFHQCQVLLRVSETVHVWKVA